MLKQMKGIGLLLTAAMIWGAAFVAQQEGMEHVGPFTFQGIRQILGFIVLLPVIFLRRRANTDRGNPAKSRAETKLLFKYGLLCGTILFFACSLQQFGLLHTTAGKSGFITALYIIIVPVCGILYRKRIGHQVWLAVMLSIVGLYFLCITDSIRLGKGDLLTLGCSLFFSAHILFIDHVGDKVDAVQLSAVQFLFSGIFSCIFMLFTETIVLSDILACWLPITYAGVLSCGVAYTFQIIGQKNTDPTLASIAMSTESVFAVLFGWLIQGSGLNDREIIGCVLMFTGIILAQLPERKKVNT